MRLLLSVSLLLQFVTVSAQTWIAKQNMSMSNYQELFNELTPKGYKPVSVNFIAVNGVQQFNPVWHLQPGLVWETRSNLTEAQYQEYFNKLTPQGYMPTDVSVYNVNGKLVFSAIWEKRPTAVWIARHNLSATQYQELFNKLTPDGYMPMHVSAYTGSNGDLLFAAIWEKRPGIAWEARHSLTATEFQSYFDKLTPQGYVPKELFAYYDKGVLKYGCIWQKIPGIKWDARYGLTYVALQSKSKEMAAKGYEPYMISAYVANGQVLYIGAWQLITAGK